MDENKELSSEEKRAKMKEEFKKDLQMRREFLNKVKGLRQTQNINRALSDMNVEDDTDDWVNKLNQETAFMEAKTELAVDMAEEAEQKLEMAQSEEELKKIMAAELVEEMKRSMMEEQKMEEKADVVHPKEDRNDENDTENPPPKPRKTLGDL